MLTRRYFLAVVALTLSPALSPAQAPAIAQLDTMKKLDFLVGEWKGEGWMEFAPGQRRTFRGTEVVQRKLQGLLLAIEGVHRSQAGGKAKEAVVHNAFMVVSYDEKAKRYRFQAYTARGNHEDTEAKVTDGQLVWGQPHRNASESPRRQSVTVAGSDGMAAARSDDREADQGVRAGAGGAGDCAAEQVAELLDLIGG